MKYRNNPEKILEILIAYKGSINKTARHIEATPLQLKRYLDERPELQQQIKIAYQNLFDKAVKAAEFLVESNDTTMTKFVLEKLGPSNGFGKETKLTIAGDPTNPIFTHTKIDLNSLSDEELLKLKEITGKLSPDDEDFE